MGHENKFTEPLACERWVLLTLVLSGMPSLVHLPGWVAIIVVIGGALHFAGHWRNGWQGRTINSLLLVATALGIHFSFDSWFSGDSILSFYIAVVFLKWGESRSNRDYLLLVFASVILAAVGALYWETLLSLLHMFVVILALTASLIAINAGRMSLSLPIVLRLTGQLYFKALPVMVLLFLTFPRIQGPLWDIGLAFGLPVKAMLEKGPNDFGKATVLKPGGIHRVSQDNGNVLVAEFKGAVPFKNRLYWRGPVFWNYDGESWHLPENWDNRSRLLKRAIRKKADLEREMRWSRNPVRYTLRVMPNGGRWLYGLEVPAAPAPESFISDEYQLLSIRKIDDHEPKLEMRSFLDYGIGEQLTDEQRKLGLAWPKKTNPRLLQMGKDLRDKFKEPEEVLQQALQYLAKEKFKFAPGHPTTPGPESLDHFFFKDKAGGAETLAGSFVLLMRAAGIPARLVSGYRGGTIIALTNFVIVKQADAHAWVEVWLDDKGWQRVEPKDIVLPPEKDDSKKEEVKPEVTPAVQLKKDESFNEDSSISKSSKGSTENRESSGWKQPDWTQLMGGLQKWVIQYNPDRQVELLKGVGVKKTDWLGLLLSTLAGVLVLFGMYLLVWWWKTKKNVDPVLKAYAGFCDQLAKKGYERKAFECPRDFSLRLGLECPEYAAGATDITERYIEIRYGQENSKDAVLLLEKQVKRFTSMI
ncbi:MAG: DUF3488 domain-containing transglutaminase family protein [Candidatus Nitronauta litoralis]|uniref:DUF3488 domain-containing transglutaminase family protein n=1 Tax=Candidatus Nitronauta litoralis TaxID=2705533 RepID=A0A7T0BWW0_9BACT|nr:MAG: DUF3488 domain-containing transglutaminase family protein [Candidatus Nitronauta litoralis]